MFDEFPAEFAELFAEGAAGIIVDTDDEAIFGCCPLLSDSVPIDDESAEFCAAGEGVELTGSCGEELFELRSSFESLPPRCELLVTRGSFDFPGLLSSLFDLFESADGLKLLPTPVTV